MRPLFVRLRLAPLAVIAVVLCILRPARADRAVNVALTAPFSAPPFLLELLESAAQENSSCYYPLLDAIADGRFDEAATDREQHALFRRILEEEGHIASKATLALFDFSLALHASAPRIQAHYQFYNTSVEPSVGAAQDAACPVWAHCDGMQFCSPALERAQQPGPDEESMALLPFDRVRGVDPDASPVVLYADVLSPQFRDFHQELSRRAEAGLIAYRLRYRPSLGNVRAHGDDESDGSGVQDQPLAMAGYGVALNLKRTDYIVIDDRDKQNQNQEAASSADQSSDDLTPLSASELSLLGYRAASHVLASDKPFDTLLGLAQDFPRLSANLSRQNISEDIINEVTMNRGHGLRPAQNQIWLNGRLLDTELDLDAFKLLDLLRQEEALVRDLQDSGLTGKEAVDLVVAATAASPVSSNEPLRYDYRDDLEGNNVIIWLNDIEKDDRYSDWPTSTLALLRPMYPGHMAALRRELNNVVIPVNLTDADDVRMVTSTVRVFIDKLIPARFGLVPSVSRADSATMVELAHLLNQLYGPAVLLDFLEASLAKGALSQPDRAILGAVISDAELLTDEPAPSVDEMLSQAQSSETRRASTQAYYERLAIETSGRYPAFFMNGVAMPRDEGFFQSMALRLNQDLHALRQRVFEGVYDDDSWLPMFYLQHALTGRNSVVAPEDGTRVKLVETGRLAMPKSQAPMPIAVIPASDDASLDGMASIMLIADLDSPAGKQQLASLLSFRNDHPAVELTLVHSSRVTGPVSRHVVQHQLLDIPLLSDWLQSSIEADTTVELEPDTWYAMERLLRDLGLAPGDTAVMLNGRVVGPLSATTVLNPSALKILRSYEGSRHIAPVVSALKQLNLHDRIRHPSELAKVTSLLAVATETAGSQSLFDIGLPVRSPAFDLWAGDHTSFVVSKSDDPVVFVNATIDPASETAQRYLPLLRALAEFEGVRVHILLNPSDDLQELPVKRFYRDVLPAAPDFNADGTRVRPQARFENLPKSTLFTLSMDVPHAWLVAAQESVHDLDNIILSSVQEGSDVDAVYGLEYILVEGHSVDTTTRTPPRGVQLLLGTDSTPHDTDTIIMANLGYFQFKSRPGYWKMSLKPGPSDQIFNLQSIGANGQRLGPATSGDAHLTLMSFQGQTLFPRLSRKKGHEEDDVLAPSSAMGSARDYISRGWNFALSLLAPSSRNAAITPANAEINIFSVASGHLYERMLNIMMVSVMRHTTHTVKFWFIEQFLSPSFKEFLPHMAQEYGFDYEMVTYKWPHWLRPQSEKQREIWGYKILFLDVLFPLSLDKVIFVDADQIVRTDMYDLVQFDLEDAPYGFTPMCDSRESMEGFRFWKQGYWKSYLAGLPYHISALYVVDLARFRALAAGDRLRGQYQALSGDPNSLANLDQDLPNHMQRVLPIKSLPQDWLWCETWCSDEALKTARTIDLCNNPLTKEPKLDRARRQVPEWTEYDEEIAALARRVARKPSEVPAPEPEASPVAHEEL